VQWWRGALVYELDVRSFGDADGDGIGDLDGLRARLGYLELLGVDIVWLEPTPIADRRTVDPLFGDLAAFDALVEAIVELRLRLVADLVRGNGPPQHHRPDRIRLALDRALQTTPFDAAAVQDAVQHALGSRAETAWSLAHHDVSRAATRYGGGAAGLARARSMALVMLALPGTAHVYQGEEVGLTDGDLPSEARARVPLPWEGGPPGFGFTTGEPWVPAPAEYGERTVACQLEDTTSTLSLYRRAIELRRTHIPDPAAPLEWYGAPPGCLAFRPEGSALVCALNTSDVPVPLPPGEVLLASGAPPEGGTLAPDTAVWLV
jgi:glycosidase